MEGVLKLSALLNGSIFNILMPGALCSNYILYAHYRLAIERFKIIHTFSSICRKQSFVVVRRGC